MTDRTVSPLLEFRNARISFMLRVGEANVVPGLSFSINPGEALGLVGESGCGKSTVALAIMRYLGRAGRVTSGQIMFEGRDIASMSELELRKIRGVNSIYHNNGIQTYAVKPDGEVENVEVS